MKRTCFLQSIFKSAPFIGIFSPIYLAQVLSGTKTSDMDHKLTLSATAIVELEYGDTVII